MPLWDGLICLSSNKYAKLPHVQATRICSDEKKFFMQNYLFHSLFKDDVRELHAQELQIVVLHNQ